MRETYHYIVTVPDTQSLAMFGRFAKQDLRFAANEWSPGYFVSTTSRQKGLPPARNDRQTSQHNYNTDKYNHMLTTARSMDKSWNPYEKPKPKPPKPV